MAVEFDLVSKPKHYNQWSVEVIEITRHLPFNVGNATKYILRHQFKDVPRQDIEKARWYLNDTMFTVRGGREVTIVGFEKITSSEPFPQPALLNLMRLLLDDARSDKPLDKRVTEALLYLADGNIYDADRLLVDYLEDLTD